MCPCNRESARSYISYKSLTEIVLLDPPGIRDSAIAEFTADLSVFRGFLRHSWNTVIFAEMPVVDRREAGGRSSQDKATENSAHVE